MLAAIALGRLILSTSVEYVMEKVIAKTWHRIKRICRRDKRRLSLD